MLKIVEDKLRPILAGTYTDATVWEAYENCKKVVRGLQHDGVPIGWGEYVRIMNHISNWLGV